MRALNFPSVPSDLFYCFPAFLHFLHAHIPYFLSSFMLPPARPYFLRPRRLRDLRDLGLEARSRFDPLIECVALHTVSWKRDSILTQQ
ncbi:uncharacterized protein SCHCODRAFT_01198414 [Schizophyllum commune H4-8]|uniref:uncharacterized protein n=1 Tax=Schizophyllum commune (strain H4-8 / FGSC 9210) TaxID=578458 RepID=UPI00215F5A1C|nr:uncharacterized protein SCHCODRAFT_01198414 [Schizophyllum commune H4-8]KAI5894469.1 hypothetical protein SCHCODRAFT_01198414 [Schizophyllum commune H4-8]